MISGEGAQPAGMPLAIPHAGSMHQMAHTQPVLLHPKERRQPTDMTAQGAECPSAMAMAQ